MRFLPLLLTLALAGAAHADETSPTLNDDFRRDKFTLKLGVVDYHYEEPGLMKIHGPLYSVEGGFRGNFHFGSWPMVYGTSMLFAWSNGTTYDGGLAHANGTVTPASNPSTDRILEWEGMFGTSLLNTEHHMINAYTGPGVWVLRNRIAGAGSYERTITYLYLPVGVSYSVRAFERYKLILSAQYNVFLAGVARSSLSNLGSKYNDVDNNQSNGSGYKFGMDFEVRFWNIPFLAGAYYQAWNIGNSDSQYSGGAYWREPKNSTKMLGVTLGARY